LPQVGPAGATQRRLLLLLLLLLLRLLRLLLRPPGCGRPLR
jgi:hypothetical protein